MQNQIQIFKSENDEITVEVKFEDDTVWLSQGQMAELFGQMRRSVMTKLING